MVGFTAASVGRENSAQTAGRRDETGPVSGSEGLWAASQWGDVAEGAEGEVEVKGCEGLRGRGCAPSWEQAAHARQFLSDSHDNICRYIARESGSVVVSVG